MVAEDGRRLAQAMFEITEVAEDGGIFAKMNLGNLQISTENPAKLI